MIDFHLFESKNLLACDMNPGIKVSIDEFIVANPVRVIISKI